MIIVIDESKDSEAQIQGIVDRDSIDKNTENNNNNNDIDNEINNKEKNEKYDIQNISNKFIVINPSIDNIQNTEKKNSFSLNPNKIDSKFTDSTDIPSLQKNKEDNGSLSKFLSDFSNSFYIKQIKKSPERKENIGREIKNIVSSELLLAAKSADIEIDDLGKYKKFCIGLFIVVKFYFLFFIVV